MVVTPMESDGKGGRVMESDMESDGECSPVHVQYTRKALISLETDEYCLLQLILLLSEEKNIVFPIRKWTIKSLFLPPSGYVVPISS